MKMILMTMAAVSALAAAAPAVAQNNNGNIQTRVQDLRADLQAGVRSGAITRREATPLREQLRQLTQLERQYGRDGINGQERSDLRQRINSLRQQIRYAAGQTQGYGRGDGSAQGMYDRNNDGWDDRDANRDGRWDVDSRYDGNRDGWDDRDNDRDGRWDVDSRYDGNRDGWDDRDTDRDGRWDDDDDGRYQNSSSSGSIVERLIDSVTGGGGLRVGERASANLGGVPYQYQSQYRDGSGSYYRSDGRSIYQIDARSHTVVRVYPIGR